MVAITEATIAYLRAGELVTETIDTLLLNLIPIVVIYDVRRFAPD